CGVLRLPDQHRAGPVPARRAPGQLALHGPGLGLQPDPGHDRARGARHVPAGLADPGLPALALGPALALEPALRAVPLARATVTSPLLIRFLAGRFIGLLGDQFMLFVVPLLAYQTTGSVADAGAVFF